MVTRDAVLAQKDNPAIPASYAPTDSIHAATDMKLNVTVVIVSTPKNTKRSQ